VEDGYEDFNVSRGRSERGEMTKGRNLSKLRGKDNRSTNVLIVTRSITSKRIILRRGSKIIPYKCCYEYLLVESQMNVLFLYRLRLRRSILFSFKGEESYMVEGCDWEAWNYSKMWDHQIITQIKVRAFMDLIKFVEE